MKKFNILLLLLLSFCVFIPTKMQKAYANDRNLTQITVFTIESKIYDGLPISEPYYEFTGDQYLYNVEIVYFIDSPSLQQSSTEKPYLAGDYIAQITITSDYYDTVSKSTSFQIVPKPVNLTLNDVHYIKGGLKPQLSYSLNITEENDFTITYYLIIDNRKTLYSHLDVSTLDYGTYLITCDVSTQNYDVSVLVANFVVTKPSMETTRDDIEFSISKTNGVDTSNKLIISNEINLEKYKSEKYLIDYAFKIELKDSFDEDISLNGYTLKVKYNVKDTEKFKIYSLNNGEMKNVVYVKQGDTLIFNIGNQTEFMFIREKSKLNLWWLSNILIILSMLEIVLATKVFTKSKNKVLSSVFLTNVFMFYYSSYEVIAFGISIYLFVFSTIYLCVKYKDNKQNKQNSLQINEETNKTENIVEDNNLQNQTEQNTQNTNQESVITKEDDLLYDIISKAKQKQEYELEEIEE